ncbi:hypothetical protein ACPPVQ_00485 [Diaminobutyricibacter sp. McL0618]|uniref:hypothetical protein n=1 Tax=Leifsonia sp. McL0618 TaxID=3415677 RepID=UPI003CFBAB8F
MEDRIPEDGIFGEDEIGEADAGETPGWVDPTLGEVDYALDDPIAENEFADELVTNDAVAGETIWPGAGGPFGGEPREPEPILDEHERVLESDPEEAVLTREEADEEGI